MNKPVADLKPEVEIIDPLAKLREPFSANQVSKLPKETKRQIEERRNGQNTIACKVCGGWHHKNAVHLDYVGHAALTDRLLDADPRWNWEPVADPVSLGLPVTPGGMWIKLTVDGVTRLGFGHPDGKQGGDAIKETIGDALRNAAMRFGAALDLWHKGDLHAHEEGDARQDAPSAADAAINVLRTFSDDAETFKTTWEKNRLHWREVMDEADYRRVVAAMKEIAKKFAAPPSKAPPPPPAEDGLGIGDDEIPF